MIKYILQKTNLSNAHTMLLLIAFLAKPMFKVSKPLLILEQTMHVMWQNIPWLVKKYFAT
jgi:hypothetical protein